jgi:hypothetical protein
MKIFRRLNQSGNKELICETRSKDAEDLLSHAESRYITKDEDGLTILEEFFEDRLINDVWRYSLLLSDDGFRLMSHCSYSQKIEKSHYRDHLAITSKQENVVLVIESPHKSEYTSDGRFIPIGPAQGTTGEKIEQYFEKLFNNSIPRYIELTEKSYGVIICNPVQYQSSLHEILHLNKINSNLRDGIWKGLFDENEFKCRLARYLPIVVINACTSGVKGKVDLAILHEYPLFKASSHPCMWNRSTTIEKLR